MITIKKFYACIAMLCLTITAFSQTGTIKGAITTSDGTPAPYVNVVLNNTQKGTITDEKGNYTIHAVEKGEYPLTASSMSYKTLKKNVVIKTDETINVNFILEETDLELNEVVISASRTPEKLSEVPASITIVGRKELKSLGYNTTNINEILEFAVPGLAPSSGTYSSWGQTLRGRKFLVMVDGIPQSTPLRNGQVDLKSVQPSDIDRVEVIKGAAAIYGNGGDGGFINYITKKPAKNTPITGSSNVWTTSNLSKTDDAFGWGVQQSLKGGSEKLSYYVSGSFEKVGNKYDGDGVVISPTYGLDNTKIFSVLGKLNYQLNDNQSIGIMVNHYQSRQKSPFVATRGLLEVFNASGDFRITPAIGIKPTSDNPLLGGATGTTTSNAQLKYTLNSIFNGTTKFEADMYYQKGKNIFFYSPNFEGGGQTVINTKKFGFRPILHTNLNLDLPVTASLTYGIDILKDKTNQGLLDGRLWVPNMDLFSMAPFVQTKFKFEDHWVLKTGVRFDNMKLSIKDYATLPYSPRGNDVFTESKNVTGGDLTFNNTSFNIGVRYIKNDEFTPYVSYSQGFSLPDLGRTLRSPNAENVKDINLGAVKTKNYEFGFLSKFKHIRFEAVGYYSTSNFGHGLTFDDDTNRFEQSKNPQKIYGAEVSADFKFLNDHLQFGASYSYVEGLKHTPDDPNNLTYIGGDVISPPKTTAYVTIKASKKISTTLRLLQVGNRERFNTTERNGSFTYNYREVPVNGYALVNFSGTYQANEKLSIALGVNNLFNKYYLPARSQWASPLRGLINVGEGINGKLGVTYNF